MENLKKINAIMVLRPNTFFTVKGNQIIFEDNNIIIPTDEEIQVEIEKNEHKENVDAIRIKLESIFNQKAIDIKSIACAKTGSNEYIQAQSEVYENMYKNAQAGYYTSEQNQEIITMNETAKQAVAPLILLINEIRHEFQVAIAAGEAVNALLINFEKVDLNPANTSTLEALLEVLRSEI